MRIKIRLDTAREAQKLANIAQGIDDKITITDNNGLCVNAKSLLGVIYALEFNELWLESEYNHWGSFADFETR